MNAHLIRDPTPLNGTPKDIKMELSEIESRLLDVEDSIINVLSNPFIISSATSFDIVLGGT